MLHPHTELRWINAVTGHGVVATRRIPKGTVVWVQCPLDIVLSAANVETLPTASRTIVDTFAYRDAHGDYILCWDLGRYVNHSCQPAMMSVNSICEIAVRDIEVGEELTCDYGLLNYSQDMICGCGSSSCRGQIRASDALADDSELSLMVSSALHQAKVVEQPLTAYLSDPTCLDGYFNGALAVTPPSAYFHAADNLA